MAPRPVTDPKNAAERRANPEAELERYGVWIKAEPQDVLEDADLGLEEKAAGKPGFPEDSFLTDEEERLLGSFEEIGTELPEGAKSLADDDFADLPPLEDFELPSESEGGTQSSGLEDFSASDIDLPLEEGEGPAASSAFNASTSDFDLEEIPDIDVLEAPEPRGGRAASPAPAAMDELVDVSADFLDLEPSSSPGKKPQQPPSIADDVTAEFLDLDEGEEAGGRAASAMEPEYESLDIDLTFDDTIDPEQGHGSRDAGFEEIADFDHVLKREEAAPRASFDDLAAVERDLSAPAPAPRTAPSASEASTSLSNELLLKIAEELSSIRAELVTLKQNFGSLQAESSPPPSGVESPAEKEPTEESHPGGFFDEEDDEKITLNIDELENILNTADFREEEAPAETLPFGEESLEAGLEDDLLVEASFDEAPSATAEEIDETGILEEVLLPDSGIYEKPAAAQEESGSPIEEIRLPEDETELLGIDEEMNLDEELDQIGRIAEQGVMPMTSAPEDTSYLEKPLPDEEALDLGEAPLEEAPLVEPDLSDFNISLEEEETEISDELPLAEDIEELHDITLDLQSIHDSTSPVELEPAPSISEIEEVGFGDLDLHHEGEEEIVDLEVDTLEDLESESLHEESLDAADEIPVMEDFELPSDLAGIEAEPAIEEVAVPKDFSSAEEERVDLNLGFPGSESAGSQLHPDHFSTSLDDSMFVESPSGAAEARAVEEEPAIESPRAEEFSSVRPEGDTLKSDIRKVLSYLDKLLESLPEDKIEEFAKSEHFETYKKLFEELGLV